MTKVLVTEDYLGDIADAIRAKNGSSDTYTPGQMAGAIAALPDAPVLVVKTISANGEYNPEDDNADGYSGVSVSVPNSYAAGDEGKVVSNGALVAQTARANQITANGTYDTTNNNSVTVNVSGGGGGQGAPYTGTTPPTAGLGSNGDVYVQTVNGGSISSDGACYIDTGIIPNALFKVEFEAAVTQQTTNYDCLFGCRNGNYGRFLARFANSTNGALAVHKSVNPSTSYESYQNGPTKSNMLNTFYKFCLKDFWTENGLAKKMFATSDTDAFPYSIYLFNFNENGPGASNNFAYAKMKYFRMYNNNNTLVAYYVAIKDNNNIPCMYDLISGVYKYNGGSGAFTYVPEDTVTAKIIWQKTNGNWVIMGVA